MMSLESNWKATWWKDGSHGHSHCLITAIGGTLPISDFEVPSDVHRCWQRQRATMSFARQRLALGVASHLRSLPCSTPSPLIAYRLLSTTSRRSHAEPINVKHEEPSHGHRLDPPGFKSPHGTATLSSEDQPGKDLDPYKGGQSAIDKAVHLFFFTEILRGAYPVTKISECS